MLKSYYLRKKNKTQFYEDFVLLTTRVFLRTKTITTMVLITIIFDFLTLNMLKNVLIYSNKISNLT